MLRRVAWLVLGLAVAYLLAANIVLRSALVRTAVESAQGVKLEYGSAHSLVPGRVHVRGLRLRFEDYNVQFELRVGDATLDLSLHELPWRRFHVLALRASNVEYRMRHKVKAVGNDGMRLSAYPRIEGFTDPPLYRGVPSPPIPDALYRLWEVRIENIVADVRELWILEYRYTGPARAEGSFLLRPKRRVEVTPGRISFDSGALRAGEHQVAERMQGTMECRIPGLDVKNLQGMEVFQGVSGSAELRLTGGSLGPFNLYAEPRWGVTLDGPMIATIEADLDRGRLGERTRVTLQSSRFQAGLGPFEALGRMTASLARAGDGMAIRLEADQTTLVTPLSKAKGPTLRRMEATLDLSGADISRPIELGPSSLSGEVEARDLSWFGPWMLDAGAPTLGGAAEAQFRLKRSASGDGDGGFEMKLPQAYVNHARERLNFSGTATARFRLEGEPRAFAQGVVTLHLLNVQNLLPLLTGRLVQTLATEQLRLGELDANVAFHLAPPRLELELTKARSGDLQAKGYLSRPGNGQLRGAVLLSAGVLHLGLALQGKDVRFSPLVGSDWLDRTRTQSNVRTSSDR